MSARVKRRCVSCRRAKFVLRGSASDSNFFICAGCRDDLGKLVEHKPYVQDTQPKGEYL